jgi:hypothetical protein
LVDYQTIKGMPAQVPHSRASISFNHGGSPVNRAGAIAILKEFISEDLVDSSYVNICSKEPEHCQIQIRSNSNKEAIEKHASKHGLIIEEDKEQKYLIIYKP